MSEYAFNDVISLHLPKVIVFHDIINGHFIYTYTKTVHTTVSSGKPDMRLFNSWGKLNGSEGKIKGWKD